MKKAQGVGGRHPIYFVRLIQGRPLIFSALLFSILIEIIFFYFTHLKIATQIILTFDLGVTLYLILAYFLLFGSDQQGILRRAVRHEEGKFFILFLVLWAAVISLVAIIAQLALAKEHHGILRFTNIGLAIGTIFLSWIFINLMFSTHYAHDYYLNILNKKPGGLDFPGTEDPNYLDFFYLSLSIGTSGQTADISFTDRLMRKTGVLHYIFTFFFNAAILALMINVLADLL
jgi:uncharacterized membrane protein